MAGWPGRAALVALTLALAALAGCGPAPSTTCSPGTVTLPRLPESGGAPGGQTVTPRPGGLGGSPQATPSPPTAVNGRVVVSDAQNGQTVTVPPGTVIEVDLVTHVYGPWTVPQSSDPKTLPRLSGTAACDGTATATFRADGSGRISARRGNREVTDVFDVVIVVTA